MKWKLAATLFASTWLASAQDATIFELDQLRKGAADLARDLGGLHDRDLAELDMQVQALKLDMSPSLLAGTSRLSVAPLIMLGTLGQEFAQAKVSEFDRGYQSGKRALDREHFDEAVRDFNASIDANAPNADGAYYWKAYALNRLGRAEEAQNTLAQLRSKFPQSRWLNEAQALDLEIKARQGHPVNPNTENNEELKLIALNGIMQSDPQRGIPILRNVLTGNQSPAIKDKALFVLSQSSSPEARQILVDLARGKGNPDLQEKAIRYISMMGSSEMKGELGRIYASTNDMNIKRQIIHSYLLSGSKTELLQAAKGERNPELRTEAIRTLAQSGGKDEIWTLYKSESSPAVKEEMVRSMLLDGDGEHLLEIAKTERDPKLRKAAIGTLAMTGWGKDSGALVDLYRKESDDSIKRELIRGLFLQQNAKGLVELARMEKNPELKRDIVQQLALIQSKESTDYMLELLNK